MRCRWLGEHKSPLSQRVPYCRARLAGNDPGALFQKCRVNPRRCFVEMQGRLLVKKRREVLAPRRELRNVMLRSEAPASSAQDETPSINPGQEVRNSY